MKNILEQESDASYEEDLTLDRETSIAVKREFKQAEKSTQLKVIQVLGGPDPEYAGYSDPHYVELAVKWPTGLTRQQREEILSY